MGKQKTTLAGRLRRAGGAIAGLGGPIYHKELRSASRRKRTFLLRLVYVLVLLVYIVLVWGDVAHFSGDITYQTSRMADAGIRIVHNIMCFQFVACQIAAVILLAGSINGELDKQTLDSLLATPLSERQILLGKLLAGLQEVLTLLAISLPVLALVRVFGGVPWSVVIAGTLAAMVASLSAGMAAILFSSRMRQPVLVIVVASLIAMLASLVLLPTLAASGGAAESLFRLLVGSALVLPVMWYNTKRSYRQFLALRQGPVAIGTGGRIPAAVLVRPVPQNVPQMWPPLPPPSVKIVPAAPAPEPVSGSPLVWRSMRRRFFRASSTGEKVALLVLGTFLAYLYAASEISFHAFNTAGFHCLVASAAAGVGAVLLLIFTSGSITTEKDSGNWILLLTTPLTDWEILRDKALSCIRRAWPPAVLLLGHTAAFVALGYLQPITFVWAMLLAIWLTVFLTGLGMYISTVARTTGRSVLVALGIVVSLWIIIPVLANLLNGATDGALEAWLSAVNLASPLHQAWAIMQSGFEHSLRSGAGAAPAGGGGGMFFAQVMLLEAALYLAVGLLLAYAAQHRFRRRAFG